MRTLASHSAAARAWSYDASDDGASPQRACDGKVLARDALERRIEHEPRERLAGLVGGIDRGREAGREARDRRQHAEPHPAERRRILAGETRARHEPRLEGVHRERPVLDASPAAAIRRISS